MDLSTCKRILGQISELMIESDWHKLNKEVANKQ